MVKVVYSEPVAKIIEVTPEIAKEYMTHNKSNRPISRNEVKKHINLLERGDYTLVADGIMFGRDGELYNGQHRLTAIIESGIPAKMVVLFGADKDAWYAQNSGRSVTNRDKGEMVLKEFGIKPELYSVAERVMNYLYYKNEIPIISKIPTKIVEDFVRKYLPYFKSVSNRKMRQSIFTNTSVALAKEVLHRMIDNEKAGEFYDRIYDNNCVSGTPEHSLLSFLIKRSLESKDQRWASAGEMQLNAAINLAFNHYIKNNKLKRLKLFSGNDLIKVPMEDPNGNLDRISKDIQENFLKDVYMK